MDDRKTGLFIAQLRREHGLTQKELAARLHVSGSTVSKWERGAGFPDVGLIEPLSEALGITITELFHGERTPEVPELCEAAMGVAVRQSRLELRRRRRADRLLAAGIIAVVLLVVGLILFWPREPELRGTWQSEFIDGHMVQVAVQRHGDERSFALYIDCRLVDEGTWTDSGDGSFSFHGRSRSFTVRLEDDRAIALIISGLNDGWPFPLKKLGDIPIYSGCTYGDEAEYAALLE